MEPLRISQLAFLQVAGAVAPATVLGQPVALALALILALLAPVELRHALATT
jgi:hypothetical protein